MEAAVNENDALSSSSDCHRPISAQQQIKKNNNNHNQPLRAIHTAPSSSTAPSSTTNTSSSRSIMNSNVNNNEQNVKVVARIRPLSTKEINEKSLECITVNTNNSTIHVTDNTSNSTSLNNDNKRTFNFDAVYNSNTTQEELYEKTIGNGNNNMISNSIFNGYNATILAYGQTGSGKVCFCCCLFEVVCVYIV